MLASEITLDLLLNAYASGFFPMSDDREDEAVFWVDPEERGIFPLEQFHLSKSLKKFIRKSLYKITYNQCFQTILQQCAMPAADRENTWISHDIEALYCELHAAGFAHSIECWHGETLVGGLYGVCLNGCFFGESMFSRKTNASKVALAYLVARLKVGGFSLLDSQFQTEHLKSMGCIEVARADYKMILNNALQNTQADFYLLDDDTPAETILQLITQIS
ncbi:leucyl/phenylalanyl-tRNA--protein transferase [Temperatibacter marinus]|uniref:Leucyl/phenylalanyl-tRNA--protein transferase n=1 Tax=Temperatibacter marinus TaxID=1456591 RepID=A0AA52EHS6_9PROT|nr:leucyl/phenylalanyl-tRNA--protein transferase [Temperatibacter marinus]WND02291.1 leucyl/phenylalanyl-tRNA--protein transferase [Temperatibacter marinus]